MTTINTLDNMIGDGISNKWENLVLKGNTYKNYSTLIVIATRGVNKVKKQCECGKEVSIEYNAGFHPWVVEGWKRLLKPMNIPVMEIILSGHEVGEAYETAIEQLLENPQLAAFNYILFMEDDIVVPYIPNSFGPLIELFKHLETYDVASALYWTKSDPPLPLTYGDGDINSKYPFEVNTNWKPGDIVEVNGTGMGFTLMKRSIFEDKRIERPFFKSMNEITPEGMISVTQDLYFYKKIKNLGYKICVDTRVKCGHLDLITELVY